VGGLCAAIDLAAAGFQVTVFERSSVAGGKVRADRLGASAIDAGPTVLTMRWVFDELFADVDRDFQTRVPLESLEVLARHAWSGRRRLDLFADEARSASCIADAFGRKEAEGYLRFRRDARRIYETVEGPFLRAQRPTAKEMLDHVARMGPGVLLRIDAARTLWRALQSYFRTPELRQLFARYATYCGSSPFEAPATLALVAHVESAGVWRVRGGMRVLAEALATLARELGASFVYDAHVERIEPGSRDAFGVRLATGEAFPSDAIIVNADASAIGTGLFGGDVRPAVRAAAVGERSLSAVTLAVWGEAKGWDLAHHNVFFSDDYPAEFRELRAENRCPSSPTVYLCAQHEDGDVAGVAGRLLLVINAPATGDDPRRWEEPEIRRCTEATLRTLERAGVTLHPKAALTTTPREYAARFPGTGGALYGPASRGPFSAMSRSGARTRIPGLYLAGGSVHPGPGLPMAALSGRLAARALIADLASIGPYPLADTSGSMSTG
jgi:1-hydroxycarotenoid 3,4-desaturase